MFDIEIATGRARSVYLQSQENLCGTKFYFLFDVKYVISINFTTNVFIYQLARKIEGRGTISIYHQGIII